MKFRYLIAVSYIDHGSDLKLFKENTINSQSQIEIVPKAKLSMLDFSLLREGFEQIPKVLLSQTKSRFIFDEKKNMIIYRMSPTPEDLCCYYSDMEHLKAFIIQRNTKIGNLYQFLKDVTVKSIGNSLGSIGLFLNSFSGVFTDAIPYLMVSAILDGLLFCKAIRIIETCHADKRAKLYDLIFKSEFTKLLVTYPIKILGKKRIFLPANSFYVAKNIRSIVYNYDKSKFDFEKQLKFLGITGINILWISKVLYELSQELFGLWSSIISIFSFAITRWTTIKRCKSLTDVYSMSLEELVKNSIRR